MKFLNISKWNISSCISSHVYRIESYLQLEYSGLSCPLSSNEVLVNFAIFVPLRTKWVSFKRRICLNSDLTSYSWKLEQSWNQSQNADCGNDCQCEKQEAQLMLTNQRDAFRGHSMCYVLACCSIVVPKTRRFQVFNIKKCGDLEIRVRGHSRSLEPTRIGPLPMTSY